MSALAPHLNIGFVLAIFFLEGNSPVLNGILQMYVTGLDITGMTLATTSMLISSKSVDFFRVHAFTVLIITSSSAVLSIDSFRSCLLNNHK